MTSGCNHNERPAARPSFRYNPFEIALCGGTDADRRSLMATIVAHFSPRRSVAQVIARAYAGPRPQTDEIGINLVYGAGECGLMYPEHLDTHLRPRPLLDADLVVMESEGDVPIEKIVLTDHPTRSCTDAIATFGRVVGSSPSRSEVPHFTPDQISTLLGWLEQHFEKRARNTPLYGLVLAGGRSTRMSRDKATLLYDGKPQIARCSELLEGRCDNVFLSIRPDQMDDEARSARPQIQDRFLDIGPMGGILSAQQTYPDAAWLVMACDLPLVDEHTVDRLIAQRNPYKVATAYVGAGDGLPEPLCAIYEPKSRFRMFEFLANGYTCPRKVLMNSYVNLLALEDSRAMENVNTPEEYQTALRRLCEKRQTVP